MMCDRLAYGYRTEDMLYWLSCVDCGIDRYFLTWDLLLAWRDEHVQA